MKRFFSLIVVCLLAVPSSMIAADEARGQAQELFSAFRDENRNRIAELLPVVDISETDQGNYGNTVLMCAARLGDKDTVAELLAKGADVNAINTKGTALTVAACFGKEDVVSMLLAKGADVNARDDEGHTALMIAIFQGFNSIAGQLLAVSGIDVNARDNAGYTALKHAEICQNKDVAQMIRDAIL